MRAPKVSDLNVAQPDFFKAESQLIGDQSLDALKAYLRFHVINGAAAWLSQPFRGRHTSSSFEHTLRGPGRANRPLEALHRRYRPAPWARPLDRTG